MKAVVLGQKPAKLLKVRREVAHALAVDADQVCVLTLTDLVATHALAQVQLVDLVHGDQLAQGVVDRRQRHLLAAAVHRLEQALGGDVAMLAVAHECPNVLFLNGYSELLADWFGGGVRLFLLTRGLAGRISLRDTVKAALANTAMGAITPLC